MEKNIVVIGKNYLTTLGILRALGSAGYTTDVIYVKRGNEDAEVISASKYSRKTLILPERSEEKLIQALLEHYASGNYVLFPTDDFSASCIDRNKQTLAPYFLMPNVVDGSVTELMDKSIQSALACKAGMKTAQEWVINLDTDPIRIPDEIPFPCFVKPLLSAVGGKRELAKCENRDDLSEKLYAMQKKRRERSVLVQEFLHISQEYTIGGVCDDQVIYIPAIIRKTRIAQHNRGVTLSGQVIDTEDLANYMPAIYAFLREVHFVGMFDLEVMMTDHGLYFGELNLRCGGPSYSYCYCGINLPELAVRAICGEGIQENNYHFDGNKTFLNNKVVWEDYAYLKMSRKELKKSLGECDFTLLSDEKDPLPEQIFNMELCPQYKMQHRKNLIKKVIMNRKI